jgi:phage-related protein
MDAFTQFLQAILNFVVELFKLLYQLVVAILAFIIQIFQMIIGLFS